MNLPPNARLNEKTARSLRAGDRVLLSGTVYTARDGRNTGAICEALSPTAKRRRSTSQTQSSTTSAPRLRAGAVIGSAGPTTSLPHGTPTRRASLRAACAP
jgi:fumarate hydratase subunit beta